MDEILTDKENVRGEIYLITNTITKKCYVGQTLTHRKNHGKFRPFGSIGRFKDHISEAICNTKKKQCTYLNSSIRKYGKDVFTWELIELCAIDELNAKEIEYIEKHNTIYPNGYNLTHGGKTCSILHTIEKEDTNAVSKRGGCNFRSETTRNLISQRIKNYLETNTDAIKRISKNTKAQHQTSKLERFKNVTIDESKIDAYIRCRSRGVQVVIGDSIANFNGKHQTTEELKTEALEFIRSLQRLQTAGSP